MTCKVAVAEGEELALYSFPAPHPFSNERARHFWRELHRTGLPVEPLDPRKADKDQISLFHSGEHVRYVELASRSGYGLLDQGDTPAFGGVFEASQYVVGTTALAVEMVAKREVAHALNPVGGLHHARRNSSAGFCVFNDIGVAIEILRLQAGLSRILYVDVDVHHGDGVYYSYDSDPEVFIFDMHEDGKYLYPGTGSAEEDGVGKGKGTKINVPLAPGSGDREALSQLPRLEKFARRAKPEFVILQCGADGLEGDPLAGLKYSAEVHKRVAALLHRLSHELCGGKMVALGGGGYVPANCSAAWIAVLKATLDS